MGLFKKNVSFEDFTFHSISIAFDQESPLKDWLDLTEEQLAELYIYNFAYCWLYGLDNNLISRSESEEKTFDFLESGYESILSIVPNLDGSQFVDVFMDRLARLREELSLSKKTQLTSNRYYPWYYFGRLLRHPLELERFTEIKYFEERSLQSWELTDMFSHQVNHLEQKLNSALK